MTVAAVSVIVPVKNGARTLGEVLAAVRAQRLDPALELIVVDSGSDDGSLEIARSMGAEVIEIPPGEFGHGRTRNLAAGRATGDALAFLTQDATPASQDWLAQLTAPLDVASRIGLSFGPHLALPDTSPMIARELVQFFGSFSDGSVRLDSEPDPTDPAAGFFSNVNSCVLRECWEGVRFRDVEYAEDQAFARDAMAAGWRKAYVPDAAVLHAHDYPFFEFMRRYFDEYRGLYEVIGHVEELGPRKLLGTTRAQVRGDVAYMRDAGWSGGRRAAWTLRSARHHAGRAVFSALGSRADRLPGGLQKALSLEGHDGSTGEQALTRPVPASPRAHSRYIREYSRAGQAPLATPSPDVDRALHIAWIVPPFRRGSGGHMALFRIALELEERGHSCSIWIHDPGGQMDRRVAISHREIVVHFSPWRAGVFDGFEDWAGADVAFATGWQTAYPLTRLEDCMLKAYLVQDYEPDFYPASAERMWAEQTYRMGYPCLASSPWLRRLLSERYGAEVESFEYGVDFDAYRPLAEPRDNNTILFYARRATPRRATDLGMLALEEVLDRRPDVRIVMFGERKPPGAPFKYEFAGIQSPAALARLYNRATLGLVLSMTNYSLVPKEMMACGLPVVDIRGASSESVFGTSGETIELAEPDPLALADRIEALLDDPERRAGMAATARGFVEGTTWGATAETIEGQLRVWLSRRWQS
jgi:glycosyltransferase involved in cell wall biosynthesis